MKSFFWQLVALSASAGSVLGANLEKWTDRSPGSFSAPTGVAFGQGIFVGVGSKLLTSEDAKIWTRQPLSGLPSLVSVTYGNGHFVATGTTGVFESPDGLSWTQRNGERCLDLLFAADRFLAVTAQGAMLVSTNGSNWTTNAPQKKFYNCLSYGAGRFVAGSLQRWVALSPDGRTWEEFQTTNRLGSITFGNEMFVAVGDGGGRIFTSTNGTDWLQRPNLPAEPAAFTFGDGKFVSATDGSRLFTSSNAVDWVQRDAVVASTVRSAQFVNGRFFLEGAFQVITSTDGLDWERVYWYARSFGGVTWGNNRFVAVGQGDLPGPAVNTSGGTIFTSPDGASWTHQQVPGTNALLAVACARDGFVAVGARGTILGSDVSGTHWTLEYADESILWRGTFHANGKTFAFGYSGDLSSAIAVRSDDTPGWKLSADLGPGVLYGLAWVSNQFVAVGATLSNGVVYTSADSINWQTVKGTFPRLLSVAAGKGVLVAVGREGAVLTSTNAIDWAVENSGITETIYRIVSVENQFIAAAGSRIYSSSDGKAWKLRSTTTATSLKDLAYGGGRIILAGDKADGGAIYQSDPLDLRFDVAHLLKSPAGRLSLRLLTPDPGTFTLDWSPDLAQWSALQQTTNTTTSLDWRVANPEGSRGFFRVRQP